jgi:integrase
MWLRGSSDGINRKESMKTRSWDRAEALKREIEQGKPQTPAQTILDAKNAYLTDCRARNLSHNTLTKLTLVLNELVGFFPHRVLQEISFEDVVNFRASWQGSDITKLKKLERLRSFFRFCHDAGWIVRNPARSLKPPKVRIVPKNPYSDEELQRIDKVPKDPKLAVFEKVLRYSALRISDVCFLKPENLDGNKIYLNTQKTGTHVGIPIPPSVAESLRALPLSGGYLFLHGNSERRDTQCDYWRDELNKVFTEAKVPNAHPHRYRANAAVRWLLAGLTIEEVAALLGNSVKIVEKHYLAWCKKRADHADKVLQSTWEKPRLMRVK